MLNTKLMLRRDSDSGEAKKEIEQAPAQKVNPEDEIDNFYEGIMPCEGELTDPFECLPPNEPQLDTEEKEAVRQEQEEQGTTIPPINENTQFTAEIIPDEEKIQNTVIIIDGVKRVLQSAAQILSEANIVILPKRKYKNVAKFDKINHAKPKEAQPSMLPKLIMAIGITLALSAYFGIEANSYYIANQDKAPTAMQCAFGWIMEYDSLTMALSPFYADIFFAAFGMVAFIMAVVIFFMWDNSEQKKRRREGKEHGAGRLATSSDFKKFKSRFMD